MMTSVGQLLHSISDGFASATSRMMFRVLLVGWMVLLLFGYVLIAADVLPEQFSWTASLILFLSAAVVCISEGRVRVLRKNLMVAVMILVAAFTLEYVGMRTGIPFGSYTYTDVLGFRLMGVPLAIAAAWYTTIMVTRRIARAIFPAGIATALAAGILTLAFDIALEPMASFIISYWRWEGGIIAWQNYASWLGASALGVFLLEKLDTSGAPIPTRSLFTTSVLVFSLQFGLFLFVDGLFGYARHAATAVLIVAGVAVWSLMGRRSPVPTEVRHEK